jgi:Asp-tRNA(Asn)/Glu-tRNA(Gln) amidotransferase A subunit family amidase
MTVARADPRELAALDACDVLPRLRAGALSVEDYARACLQRIALRDPVIHAWAHLDVDHVLAQARALDRRAIRGPLHGLPVGVKDIFLTEDMPTQYNSEIYRGAHPRMDAACVALLREAGALILGKTETVEFASARGRSPPTRNPRDLGRTPGGSSSGSAAAVADFQAPLAFGTQTGGSVIRPASFCGVFALKPTWGLVSRDGVRTFAPSLDTIGWFTRSAADLILIYDALDPDPAPHPNLVVAGSRIGLCRSPAWDEVEEGGRAALESAAGRLRAAGAQVIDLDLPAPFQDLNEMQARILNAEAQLSFLAEYRTQPDLLHPTLRAFAENAAGLSRAALRQAYDVAAACRAVFDQLASAYDAVLTPSAVGEAPEGLDHTGLTVCNTMWSLLHTPCINVPGLVGPAGMPVGVTLTGPRYEDRKVLAAAAAIAPLLGN